MSIGIYVALVFLIIAGIFFMVDLNKYLKIVREYKASHTWQSVLGRITNSTVEIVKRSVYNDETGREETYESYFPKLEYSFDVHGETQENVRVAFGVEWIDSPAIDKWKADEIMRRHPTGAQVMVYFDPEDPSKAVLERRIIGNYVSRLVWKFIFVLVGVGLVILVVFQ